jgi:lipopolysaccharide/colanic/teichoic acid biosynthesis glycosyltransferase
MIIKFCKRLFSHNRTPQLPPSHRISSADEFRSKLAVERARADRNGHGFSLVAFKVGEGLVNDALARCVERVVAGRLRVADELGWFDEQHLGVLLYNTPAEGAWNYVNQVQDALSAEKAAVESNVYVYPTTWTGAGEGTGEPGEQETIRENVPLLKPDTETGPQPTIDFIAPLPAWKRAMDILGSFAAIVVFSPVMLAIAMMIKLSSKGPVIFKQQRAGFKGKPFTCYKFRSMVIDAEDQQKELLDLNERSGISFKMTHDPRVTRAGKLLRKTSLDELPQFFNVLKGDMSLVGPRPIPVKEAMQQDTWHNMRLEVHPGITCLWQIYARNSVSFDSWARLDIEYIRKRSLLLDLKLLLLTIPAVLSQRGAH